MKRSLLRIILGVMIVLLAQVSSAQVGINTDDPDQSAMLDISSTTSGLLMPRMLSAERFAIPNPAEGLLVYDITTNNIYVFQDAAWTRVDEKRSNYKIVKTLDDLEEELTAGGNTKYLLNENSLYEINGTINIDFPIDMNGAYITGEDTGEDELVNTIAGNTPLFEGYGGSIRNLTINGNAKPVFNIDGSAVTNSILVVNNSIFREAGSLGELQNLGVVFFDVSQYLLNQEGLTVRDVNSLYMLNQFWTASNQGTYLKLNGAFDNIQMATGRIVADAGETGLDVSANPSVDNSASLAQISFVGEGNLVNGYTSGSYPDYNFSKDWYVNCQGIPLETDRNATGDINLTAPIGSGVNTVFTGTGTSSRRKVAGNTVSNDLFRFSDSGENRIVYEGEKTRFFGVSVSTSFQASTANNIFIFYLAKGNAGDATATVIETSRVYVGTNVANEVESTTIIDTVQLGPGDFIEVWAERFNGSGNILTVSLSLLAR